MDRSGTGISAGVLTGESSPRGDGQARGARSRSIRFLFRRVSEHEGHHSLIVAGVAGEFGAQHSKPRRSRPWLTVLVLVLVLAPVLAVCVSVIGRHWHTGGDQALEMLRIEDVGTSHTPLLGAWSRWGWAHPGPALFWALSPFYRVFGETGVPIGMGVLNGAAIAGVVLVAHRRGGSELAALAGLMMALLIRSLGVSLLVDIWNPWAAFLPFVMFVMLAWAVLCRDWAMLPIAVFVGSCVVQIHAGYLPLVAPLLAFVAAFAVVDFVRRHRAASATFADHGKRWLIATGAVAIAVWMPALVQQVTTSNGNLAALFHYVRDPSQATAGWTLGVRHVGRGVASCRRVGHRKRQRRDRVHGCVGCVARRCRSCASRMHGPTGVVARPARRGAAFGRGCGLGRLGGDRHVEAHRRCLLLVDALVVGGGCDRQPRCRLGADQCLR